MSWWLSTSSLYASSLQMTPWQFCRMGDRETCAHVSEAKNGGYLNDNFSVDLDAWPLAGKIQESVRPMALHPIRYAFV